MLLTVNQANMNFQTPAKIFAIDSGITKERQKATHDLIGPSLGGHNIRISNMFSALKSVSFRE